MADILGIDHIHAGDVASNSDEALYAGANLATNSSLVTTSAIDAHVRNSTGLQIGAQILRVITDSGQSSMPDQLSALLTALYHNQPFAVPLWVGIETGACFIDGTGAEVVEAYGIVSSIPLLLNGGIVSGKAAAVYIDNNHDGQSGIADAYGILSDTVNPSKFAGPMQIGGPVKLDGVLSAAGAITTGETVYGETKTGSISVVTSSGVNRQFAMEASKTMTFTLASGTHGVSFQITNGMTHEIAEVRGSFASATLAIIYQSGSEFAVTSSPSASQIGVSKTANSYTIAVKTGGAVAASIGIDINHGYAASTTDPA